MEVFRLRCGYQNYAWGNVGSHSCISQYLASAQPETIITDNEPLAELWMGVHPSRPSVEYTSGQPLLALLETHESILSPNIARIYGKTLPFLFKILSISTALSIQAHPDKTLAAQLHHTQPEHYPDANHKPEMAIAITRFEALCGFRPLHEIAMFLTRIRALKHLVGEAGDTFLQEIRNSQNVSELREDCKMELRRNALRHLVSTMTSQPDAWIRTCAQQLIKDILDQKTYYQGPLFDLILRLNKQFPMDIGLFYTFLLNYIELAPGECIFLQVNTPHAYLSGDIIECMASSDNVVRAGFTSKFKDVKTLVSMLTYHYGSASAPKIQAIDFDRSFGQGIARLFKPPVDEFRILHISLNEGHVHTVKGLSGPSILICTQGSCILKAGRVKHTIHIGYVFFVSAFVATEFSAISPVCVIYRAFVEAS